MGAMAAAISFVPAAWRGAWAALGLATVALALWLMATSGGRMLLPAPVWLVLALAAMLVARGALWRLVLARPGRGPGGLQLAGVEGRLASVWVLSGVFLGMLLLLLFVAVLCVAYAAASAGRGFDASRVLTWAPALDGPGRMVLGAAAAAGAAGVAFAGARISLAEAASVARGRVQVLSTWGLSRGAAWPILAGAGCIAAPSVASFLLLPAGPTWRVAQALVVAGLCLPMSVGLMAYVFANRTARTPDR